MRCQTIVRLALYLSVAAGSASSIAHGVNDTAVAHPRASCIPRLLPAMLAKHRTEVGIASWYGYGHQGKLTASGKPFDARKLTAAHPTLPFNSKVKVTNLDNGKSVDVTITDRGPGVPGRAIDLSLRAAQRLGMKKQGLALVEIQPIYEPPAIRAAFE